MIPESNKSPGPMDQTNHLMESNTAFRLSALEKKYARMQLGFYATVILLVSCVVYFGIGQRDTFGLIRARGIIIEDEAGKDRILIGAPIPFSADRVRTDTALVRKYWAKNYGSQADEYMEWYKDYYHGTDGIVIMNERGFDRVLVGDKLADPNSGKRMFQSAGVAWNDGEGWELGGAGVNTASDGKARSVIGLDNDNGEAVHLVALEDGTNALIIAGSNGRLMIGSAREPGAWFQNKMAFTGIRYFDAGGNLVWEQEMSLNR